MILKVKFILIKMEKENISEKYEKLYPDMRDYYGCIYPSIYPTDWSLTLENKELLINICGTERRLLNLIISANLLASLST